MFFIRKDQVDKDVEKLRESLMTPYQIHEAEEKKAKEKKHHAEQVEDFGWKDVVAMTIAMIQVIFPYLLMMAAAMVVIWKLIYFAGTH